ncbi:DNA gyrase inhibitor YacG [Sphingomonas jejuensis]|uniref:DNA gyrase inhibitor YacG n=1 Tax=Sphingomonas jejuensis TaxID=904715 RepID=UPI001439C5CB|nr:DNA gyrase inhibitor YacG [Sphingomonas jejuensis]
MSTASRSNAACPICGTAPSPEFKPFCSRGCRDRDLLNWLGDGYRLPGKPVPNGLDSDADPAL